MGRADADAGGVGTTTGVVRAFWSPTCRRTTLNVYPSLSAKGHAHSQGGEMSQSTTTSARTPEAARGVAPTSAIDGTTPESVLITAQEVLFSTRMALLLRKASGPHRWIDAIRDAAGSLHLPPPRQHHRGDACSRERPRGPAERPGLGAPSIMPGRPPPAWML